MLKKTNKLVGGKLRELRLKRDIKESELAKLLQINNSTYSRIERGEITLSEDKALLLSDYYKIDLKEIYPYSEQIQNNDKQKVDTENGHINSVSVPRELLENMSEIIKQNSQILAQFVAQQKNQNNKE